MGKPEYVFPRCHCPVSRVGAYTTEATDFDGFATADGIVQTAWVGPAAIVAVQRPSPFGAQAIQVRLRIAGNRVASTRRSTLAWLAV